MLRQLLILLASTVCIIASVTPTEYTYKTVGNLSIQAAVYVPNITLQEKYPVMMVIHGGGFIFGGCETDAFSLQELYEMLARGWVVVSIDYRLSPQAFLPDMVSDVQDAYNWIRTELVNIVTINPDSIAIWGDSAGAGLTVIAGYTLSPPPKALIAFYTFCTDFTTSYTYIPDTPVSDDLVIAANNVRVPITEYPALVPTDPRYVMLDIAAGEVKLGWLYTTADQNASPDDILAELKQYSVIYNINATYPPTYLIHGLNDTTVPYNQSVNMAYVLASENVPYVLDLVPGVGHAFDLGGVPEQMWIQHILPIFDFTQKYLITETETANVTEEILI